MNEQKISFKVKTIRKKVILEGEQLKNCLSDKQPRKKFEFMYNFLRNKKNELKDFEIYLNKEYNIIYYTSENLGNSRFPDWRKELKITKMKFIKETNNFLVIDEKYKSGLYCNRLCKDKIIGVLRY